MERFVSKGASLGLRLFREPRGEPLFPFSCAKVSYWHSGKTALWQGIHRLGLQPGDRILVPAYSCGDELDVLLQAELELVFYRIDDKLQPDFDHLGELLKRDARALYFTNYLGFAQPIDPLRSIASAYGLLLIEDNAHGLFSQDEKGRWLGARADCGIFSLSKKLPLPDGGALYLDDRFLSEDLVYRGYGRLPWSEAFRCAAKLASLEIFHGLPRLLFNIVSRRRSELNVPQGFATYVSTFNLSRGLWLMSSLSLSVARHLRHLHIRNSRQRNYRIINREFKEIRGLRRLFDDLPIGCCPWFFPVVVDEPQEFIEHMWASGVWAGRFWEGAHPALSLDHFPTEANLKRKLVVLPIHAGISEAQMGRICDSLNEWCGTARDRKMV